jgi:hypothetical protein
VRSETGRVEMAVSREVTHSQGAANDLPSPGTLFRMIPNGYVVQPWQCPSQPLSNKIECRQKVSDPLEWDNEPDLDRRATNLDDAAALLLKGAKFQGDRWRDGPIG